MVREGEPTSNTGFKGRLYLTKEQEKLVKHNMQIARATYNWARYQNLVEYEKWDEVKKTQKAKFQEQGLEGAELEKAMESFNKANKQKYISSWQKLGVMFTKEVKENSERWGWFGKDYDSYARCYVFGTSYKAALRIFNDDFAKNSQRVKEKIKRKRNFNPRYPKDYGFPQYKKDADSYTTEIKKDSIDYETNTFYLPKIGRIRVTKNQPLPKFDFPSKKLGSPRITYDGRNYYLCFGYYKEPEKLQVKETEILGIDLGLKSLASLSDDTVVENVCMEPKCEKLEQKIKKLQRKLSWLTEHSPVFYNEKDRKKKFKLETRQTRTLKKRIRKVQLQLLNYKKDKIEVTAENIVRKNPKGIIFEDLNVKGMFKNKKMSSKLQKTGMSAFKTCLVRHARKHEIVCKEADRWFASSQICSECGYQDVSMKNLSKRVFKCPKCGTTIDRDVNAAKNLQRVWEDEKTKICK